MNRPSLFMPAVTAPPPDNLVIAKLKNCRRGQAAAATSAAAEVAVAAAAELDVAVASSGLTYVTNLAPDCWVLLRADTAETAGAAVAALAASGKPIALPAPAMRRFLPVHFTATQQM
jgi:sarcosine oxidase gamma subunit